MNSILKQKKHILELNCYECKNINMQQSYQAEFNDHQGKKYKFLFHESIPIDHIIRINPYHHDFSKEDDSIIITVKQKFTQNCHPEILELEIIDYYKLKDSIIITFRDTTTLDIYKMKDYSLHNIIGDIVRLDLNSSNLTIKSMPHYYEKYTIENWILPNNIIETL